MATQITLPPNTRAVNDPDPAADMDKVSTALSAMAATSWVFPTGDTSGADDSANIQEALNSTGAAFLGAGTFYADDLNPVSFARLAGLGADATIINMVTNSWMVTGASLIDTFEIGNLTVNAPAPTGKDIFSGADAARWYVHDCHFVQNDAAHGIWNATLSGSQVFITNKFCRNREDVFGATRTVEAWFLSSPGASNGINQNTWQDITCFNRDADTAKFWYHLQHTGSSGSSNEFRDMVFEHTYGGAVLVESMTRTVFDNCQIWDVSSATSGNSFFSVIKNSGGNTPTGTTFRSCGRQGATTLGAGCSDIQLDANCSQTLISAPRGTTPNVTLDLGNSTQVTLEDLPQAYTLVNAGSATWGDLYANLKVAPAAAAEPAGFTGGAPTGTTQTTAIMMGMGSTWVFTPQSSGKVLVAVAGGVTTATAPVQATYAGRFGTGTAPANADAVTGSLFGSSAGLHATPPAAGAVVPFAITAVLSLTPGTAYWFDVELATANAADAASYSGLAITIVETS